jgi:hypothetical protein
VLISIIKYIVWGSFILEQDNHSNKSHKNSKGAVKYRNSNQKLLHSYEFLLQFGMAFTCIYHLIVGIDVEGSDKPQHLGEDYEYDKNLVI